MNKAQIKKIQSERGCFGTKEWSKNSGICKRCEFKVDCEKIDSQREN